MTEQEAKEILTLDDDMKKKVPHLREAYDAAVNAIEELQQYRAIGTVEECREAREKQREKSPDVWGDGYSEGEMVYDMYDCPSCGEGYEINGEKYNYCPNCGQALDWSIF